MRENGNEEVKIYLIGNKSEMAKEREVPYEKALEFAKKNNIHMVWETSAKTGFNVEDVFSIAGKEIYLTVKKEEEIHQQEKEKQDAKKMKEGKKYKSNQRKQGKKLTEVNEESQQK